MRVSFFNKRFFSLIAVEYAEPKWPPRLRTLFLNRKLETNCDMHNPSKDTTMLLRVNRLGKDFRRSTGRRAGKDARIATPLRSAHPRSAPLRLGSNLPRQATLGDTEKHCRGLCCAIRPRAVRRRCAGRDRVREGGFPDAEWLRPFHPAFHRASKAARRPA